MSAFQKTEQWHSGRVGRITGSRIGAVLGIDKNKTPDDVMRGMVRDFFGEEQEFTGNEATEYGNAHEDDAIDCYEALTGAQVKYTGQHVHKDYGWLAASPDGLVGHDGLIEVKCPFRAKYTKLEEVPHTNAQIQLQLEVTGRDWCDFVIWREGAISVERVAADKTWLSNNMGALAAFFDDYQATIASEELSARHLAPLIREDATWQALEADYLDAKAAADEAGERLDAAKKALITAAGEQSQKGKAVQVIRSERSGSVAYAKAIAELAPDADLTKYTGKPSVVYTVKECK